MWTPSIEFSCVTKRYGPGPPALTDASFTVIPGTVTALLGPNGSGKTTALRVLLGLERADQGQATIGGIPYRQRVAPLHSVGALLSAAWIHPKRTARDHLRWIAAASLLPERSVQRALDTVGLADVADDAAGGFSLGMRQRLGIATTILGDPSVLIYDEPLNGLDQLGVEWVRNFFLHQAELGRTVLVSSHLLSEVEQSASQAVVLGRGSVVFSGAIGELTSRTAQAIDVELDATQDSVLAFVREVERAGWSQRRLASRPGRPLIRVEGVEIADVVAAAQAAGAAVRSVKESGTLEQAYADLTVQQNRFPGRQESSA